jgi:DNA-binding XRE family transcriptional regulator
MPNPYRKKKPKIREWRLVWGMTQETLARRAKIRRPTISDIERGEQSPTLDTVKILSRILRVSVDDLYTDPFATARKKVDRRRKRR